MTLSILSRVCRDASPFIAILCSTSLSPRRVLARLSSSPNSTTASRTRLKCDAKLRRLCSTTLSRLRANSSITIQGMINSIVLESISSSIAVSTADSR